MNYPIVSWFLIVLLHMFVKMPVKHTKISEENRKCLSISGLLTYGLVPVRGCWHCLWGMCQLLIMLISCPTIEAYVLVIWKTFLWRLFCFFVFTIVLFHRKKPNTFWKILWFWQAKRSLCLERVACMLLLIKLGHRFNYSAKQIQLFAFRKLFLGFFCNLKKCLDGGNTSVTLQYLLFSTKSS